MPKIYLRLILIFLAFFSSIATCDAQEITVTDMQKGTPLNYVKVVIKKEGPRGKAFWGGFTNEQGKLELPENLAGGDKLHLSFIGHQPQNILFSELKEVGYSIQLFEKKIELDEVRIASRLKEKRSSVPQRVEVIDAKEIEFQNPQTSADMLVQNGGVFVQKSQMGGGSPNLRGFEANKVLLVIDGVRMNNAIFRGGHLQNVITIDPNMVESTEVLFGPASVVYGSDALGGVIHFYSKKPKLAIGKKFLFKGNGFTRYSSANQERTGHIDLNFGFEKVAFLTSFSGSYFNDLISGKWHPSAYPDFGKREYFATRSEGQDTMVANDNVHRQRFSGYNQYDFMQKIMFLTGPNVTHHLNFQYTTSSDIPRYDRLSQMDGNVLRYADWHYGPQKRMMASYAGSAFRERGFFDQINWVAAFQDIEESRITRRFGQDNENHRIEKVRVLSVNLDLAKLIKEKHNLNYGIEFVQNWVNSTAFSESIVTGETTSLDTRYPDGGSEMRNMSAYFSHKWDIAEKLYIMEGIRATSVHLHSEFTDKSFFPFLPDEITQNNAAASGNIGLSALPGKGFRIALLGASGFRSPNVDDLGKVFDSSPGNVIVPNANVNPEYTFNTELTLSKTIQGRFKIEATGFYTLFRNALVVRDFQADGQDSILYEGVLSNVQAVQNAGKAYIYGANANISVNFARYFTWSGTVTYTYGRDQSNEVPLDHIPPFFGRSGVKFEREKLSAEVYTIFNGRKPIELYSPSGEDNERFAPDEGVYGWATLNFKAAYSFAKYFTLQAGVENILDSHYRHFASGISAPGRNFIVALRAKF